MKDRKYLISRGKVVLSDYREFSTFNLCRNRFSRVLRTLFVVWVVAISAYLATVGFLSQIPC